MRITQAIIYLLFFISLAVLGILSFFFLKGYASYIRYTSDVEKTYKLITEITELESLLKDTETGNRGYLLTQDSVFLQPLLRAENEIRRSIADIAAMTVDNIVQQKQIAKLNMLIQDKRDAMKHTRLMFLYNKDAYLKNLRISRDKMDECRKVFKEMKDEESRLLATRSKNKYFYESKTPEYLTVIFSFSAITFIVSCFVIIREFRSRKKYQNELELKLNELHQSNAELEQIAYVASHDLQEPLRKINTFTDRLVMKHAKLLDDEGKTVINRISSASNRMRGLVEDLANYTSIVQLNEKKLTIDLKEIMRETAESLKEEIAQKKAQLFWDNLPSLTGYHSQVQMLFKALIDNSIKFSQPDVPPRIHIYGNPSTLDELAAFNIKSPTMKFIKITLRDNGIGFDNEFAEKMFGIFQRLHTQYSEYDGKGIGLAIVKRVMANHNGYVFAKGFPMTGAEFILFFPAT